MSTLEEALVSSCWIKAAMDPTQIKHWKIEIHAGYFSISQVYNLITNGTSKNAGESLISHLLLFGKTIWKVRVYRYNVGFERKLLKQQTIETLSSCPMLHSQQPTVIIATRWAGCVASLGCLAWEEPHQLCQKEYDSYTQQSLKLEVCLGSWLDVSTPKTQKSRSTFDTTSVLRLKRYQAGAQRADKRTEHRHSGAKLKVKNQDNPRHSKHHSFWTLTLSKWWCLIICPPPVDIISSTAKRFGLTWPYDLWFLFCTQHYHGWRKSRIHTVLIGNLGNCWKNWSTWESFIWNTGEQLPQKEHLKQPTWFWTKWNMITPVSFFFLANLWILKNK